MQQQADRAASRTGVSRTTSWLRLQTVGKDSTWGSKERQPGTVTCPSDNIHGWHGGTVHLERIIQSKQYGSTMHLERIIQSKQYGSTTHLAKRGTDRISTTSQGWHNLWHAGIVQINSSRRAGKTGTLALWTSCNNRDSTTCKELARLNKWHVSTQSAGTHHTKTILTNAGTLVQTSIGELARLTPQPERLAPTN